MTNQTTYMDAADVAKKIRIALKEKFPDTKFSVRTSKYSMGASVRVTWTDGPTVDDVNKIVKPFEGSSFDGMIDLKSSNGPLESLDGVASMADYIFTERTISDEYWNELAVEISEYYHVEIPTREDAWKVFVVQNSTEHFWSFDSTLLRRSEGR